MAIVTINGRDLQGSNASVMQIFHVVSAVIESGEHEWLVIDGSEDGGPVKNMFLITSASSVSATLDNSFGEDVADSAHSTLDRLYKKYVEEPF